MLNKDNDTPTQAPTTTAAVSEKETTVQKPEKEFTAKNTTKTYTAEQTSKSTPKSYDVYDIHQGGKFIVKNTPDSAGLVKRSDSSSKADHLGVLKEGSVVTAYYDYTSLDNGYACVYESSSNNTFFVLAKYLQPYNPYESSGYSYSDLRYGMTARISFNTPAHAGLNLRSGPGSQYDLLCQIEEGSVIDVLEDYSSEYIKIGYDHPHAGHYYEGWVLAKHLEYYN